MLAKCYRRAAKQNLMFVPIFILSTRKFATRGKYEQLNCVVRVRRMARHMLNDNTPPDKYNKQNDASPSRHSH